MTQIQRHSTTRFRGAFLACSLSFAVVFSILILRLAYLQIWKGEFFRNLSENNRIRLTELHAPRGKILDRHHETLVDNRPCFDVTIIPEEVRDYHRLWQALAPFSPLDPEALQERLSAVRKGVPFRTYVLWKDASWNTVAFLEANRLRLPGVMIQVAQARDYLTKDLFAHVIGYMGEISAEELRRRSRGTYRIGDWIGKAGIEKTWEDALRGEKGGLQIEVDALGRQISILKKREPVPGKNLVLSLDRRLQEAARQAFGTHAGVAVALDPRNGRILCYLALPSYDPNSFIGGISREEWDALRTNPYHPLTDRIIQGLYPPGSIFKIVVAVAALEEGIISPDEKLLCTGKYRLGSRDFRCWKKAGHGMLNLHEAIVQSCDVYFYQLGQRLGIERIEAWARKLGFGSRTGIALEGEKAGLIPSPQWKRRHYGKPWYEGETLVVSIGQGAVLVTPLQVLTLMAAVANGGTLWRPTLVRDIESADGRVIRENSAHRNAFSLFSPVTDGILRSALRDVVNSDRGTARSARLPDVEVAGKTGTAQVVAMEEQKGEGKVVPRKQKDHSWFACYAPQDSPEIALVVLVEHGGHGGETAAPIARKILEAYFGETGRSFPPPVGEASRPAR